MKLYKFVADAALPEAVMHNPDILKLVRSLQPDEVSQALISKFGLPADEAASTAGALMRHANDSMSMPYRSSKDDEEDPDHDLRKLSKKRAMQPGKVHPRQRGQLESFSLSPPDVPITKFYFPDEREEPDDWPYDDATQSIMNFPYSGKVRFTT